MIESSYNRLIDSIEGILRYKYWYLHIAVFTFMLVWFLATPSYYSLRHNDQACSSCTEFQEKIDRADHLLKPKEYPDESHMAKTELRLTVPLIAKLTGIRSKVGIFTIQEILGILFLVLTCLLVFRITGDKVVSALFTLSIGFIHAGKAAFVDDLGGTDSFAYFFLLLALFTHNKPVLLISLLLAYFADERAIVTSALIAIYFLAEHLQQNSFKFSKIANSRVFYIGISWILCVCIRYFLYKVYGLHTPLKGVGIMGIPAWGYIFWEGLQGFWLIVIGCFIYLVAEKRFVILSLIVIGMLQTMIVAAMVYDITRSLAYIFPVIFLSLYFLEKGTTKPELRKLALLCCLICFLSADSWYIVDTPIEFYRSLPLKIIYKALSG